LSWTARFKPATGRPPGIFSPVCVGLVDSLPKACRPAFLRGDYLFGNDSMMGACEQGQLDYSFKLRLTTQVKALIQMVRGTQA
jgi:hypothetical protein